MGTQTTSGFLTTEELPVVFKHGFVEETQEGVWMTLNGGKAFRLQRESCSSSETFDFKEADIKTEDTVSLMSLGEI
jgi:hypothetical protein